MGCHPSHWRTPSFFKMGTLHHQPEKLYHVKHMSNTSSGLNSRGSSTPQFEALRRQLATRVLAVTCGEYSTVALLSSGELYAWGHLTALEGGKFDPFRMILDDFLQKHWVPSNPNVKLLMFRLLKLPLVWWKPSGKRQTKISIGIHEMIGFLQPAQQNVLKPSFLVSTCKKTIVLKCIKFPVETISHT